ncbi:Ig-like domain-containing protein [Psychrobacillus sp. NPDC096426]|uniref:Ig-like domain-containing protein n=1 Tax=Psychrobacillus sp. NPDC096426 TaxID=3364491 RepID=UPI0038203038
MTGKKLIYTTFAAMIMLLTFQPMFTLAKDWEYKTSENVNKVWKVRFNMQLNTSSLNSSNVYVTDGQNVHPTTVTTSNNGYVVEVKPTKSYSVGKQYTLFIKNSIQSTQGKTLKTGLEVPFQIVDPSLNIQYVQSNTNSIFTTVTVNTNSDVHRVTISGDDMIYKGSNKFTYTLVDAKPGSLITIYAYDENNKSLETKKYTLGN